MNQHAIVTRSVLLLAPLLLLAQQKRSVSVEAFDYSTVQTDVQTIFGTQLDIGRGITSLIAKQITDAGYFTVVERGRLDVLTKEQDLGASGRVKKGTQARIGEIRGADFTLLGAIVTFGRDDSRKAVVGGVIVPGAGGIGGGSKSTGKAVVTLSFRMANTETSEVVATGEARGESSRTSKGGFLGLVVGPVFGGGAVDFSSRNFSETIIGEAVIDAVNKLMPQLKCDAGLSARRAGLEGRVANVSGPTVYINIGSAVGVQVGDLFDVSEVTGEVRDPVTHEVLDLVATSIGKMTIISVREKIAIGTYNGVKPPKPADRVEKK